MAGAPQADKDFADGVLAGSASDPCKSQGLVSIAGAVSIAGWVEEVFKVKITMASSELRIVKASCSDSVLSLVFCRSQGVKSRLPCYFICLD